MNKISGRLVSFRPTVEEEIGLGSPVYWCSVTGLTKTFIDRLYYCHHCANSPLLHGKSALVVATVG